MRTPRSAGWRQAILITLAGGGGAAGGARVALTLRTASGKPIGPGDLTAFDGRKIQLLILDPALRELQQVRPAPSGRRGRWGFDFTPGASGSYRIFADFIPRATGKEMYVWADLAVAGAAGVRAPAPVQAGGSGRLILRPLAPAIDARIPVSFTVSRADGAPLAVGPLDGAWGRLVIVDQSRGGLAYLHPPAPPGAARLPPPVFRVTLSDPGHYKAWATVAWNGRPRLVPLRFAVQP